jgi:hypothetical protein
VAVKAVGRSRKPVEMPCLLAEDAGCSREIVALAHTFYMVPPSEVVVAS